MRSVVRCTLYMSLYRMMDTANLIHVAETDEKHLNVIRQKDIELKSSLELVQTTASEVAQV